MPKVSSLSFSQRATLAKEVEHKIFRETNSYRQDGVGAELAYLLGAILDNGKWENHDNITAGFLKRLRKFFSKNHDIWRFIIT
jgi:hypothetical protein